MADLDPAIKARAAEQFQALQKTGAAAFAAGDFGAAEDCFRRAAELAPMDASVHNNLGQAMRAGGKTAAAEHAFWKALDLDPVFAEPAMNLGLMAAADGDWERAIGFYAKALTRRSNYAEAHFNWAIALERLGQRDGAIDHYRRALQFRPAYLQAINNLAAMLDEDGLHREAEALFRAGLEGAPETPELWSGLGSNQRAAGNLDAARDAYKRALELRPDFPECRWNLALVQLAKGDFAGGWANYRYRPTGDRERTPFPAAPLPAGPVDIVGEQGLGDEVFFLRFAAALAGQGIAIRYAPDAKLRPMLERLDFIEVVAAHEMDACVSVADLPFLMGLDAPPPSIRLQPDGAHLARMRNKLAAAGPPPYLGFTWRAGIRQSGSLFKEIPALELTSAIQGWPGTLINLQREPRADERGVPGADFTACNDDLEDMLALMALIDDVVGVSNTNMHLRAAVGGKAHVLVAHPAEYRWMASGDTSPWFPDFRTYRQAADGSWGVALEALRSNQ
jgi:Flp pilus assembly protein TadD